MNVKMWVNIFEHPQIRTEKRTDIQTDGLGGYYITYDVLHAFHSRDKSCLSVFMFSD